MAAIPCRNTSGAMDGVEQKRNGNALHLCTKPWRNGQKSQRNAVRLVILKVTLFTTVYNSFHKRYVVTLVDHRSKYLLTGICRNKKPSEVADVLALILETLPKAKLRSVTLDRGQEFALHGNISENPQCCVLLCASLFPLGVWNE